MVQLKFDLYVLQTCVDQRTFAAAAAVFISTWKAKEDHRILDVLQYFQAQELDKNANRYEGAAPGYPSSNNGLEVWS